jgi:hypothetical protein
MSARLIIFAALFCLQVVCLLVGCVLFVVFSVLLLFVVVVAV